MLISTYSPGSIERGRRLGLASPSAGRACALRAAPRSVARPVSRVGEAGARDDGRSRPWGGGRGYKKSRTVGGASLRNWRIEYQMPVADVPSDWSSGCRFRQRVSPPPEIRLPSASSPCVTRRGALSPPPVEAPRHRGRDRSSARVTYPSRDWSVDALLPLQSVEAPTAIPAFLPSPTAILVFPTTTLTPHPPPPHLRARSGATHRPLIRPRSSLIVDLYTDFRNAVRHPTDTDRPFQPVTRLCDGFPHPEHHTKYLYRTPYVSPATPTQMTAGLSTTNRVRSHVDDAVGGDDDRARGEGDGKAAVVDTERN